jgi:hypothetical protein
MKYVCVLLCVVILAACSNVLPLHAPQEGGVTITISNGISQRTLYPDIPVFTKYVLSFESAVGGHEDVILLEGNGTVTVTDLEPGEWVITATGYVTIEGEELPAASGSVEVTVVPGVPADVEIPIRAAEQEPNGEPGFFRYSVSVDADIEITCAELFLYPFSGNGESDAVHWNTENKLSGSVELPPGFYLMTMNLIGNNGYITAGLSEVVHIYSNMETVWEPTFNRGHFAEAKRYSLTVGLIKEQQTGVWYYGNGSIITYGAITYGDVYIGEEGVTTYDFPAYTEVTVTAVPANSYFSFVKWVLEDDYNGNTASGEESYTFTITGDTSLYGIFDGNGSYNAPKNIGDIETLKEYLVLDSNWDIKTDQLRWHYALMSDLDLGSETWTPIGRRYANDDESDYYFNGTFDGRGHTIKLASIIEGVEMGDIIYSGRHAGFFGYIGPNGKVKNLILEGSVAGDYTSVGALAGTNLGIIINVLSRVKVTNNSGYAGGIVGYNSERIYNCVSTGDITGNTSGGIAGVADRHSVDADAAKIMGCWVSGNIDGKIAGGCIAGALDFGTIVKNCVALSEIVKGGADSYGRIGGNLNADGPTLDAEEVSFVNNYALHSMEVRVGSGDDYSPITIGGNDANTTTKHGEGVVDISITKDWWVEKPGDQDCYEEGDPDRYFWTFAEDGKANEANPWVWDNSNNRPKLWFVEQ